MSRSPARFLAPVALIAAILAIYLVAKPQLQDSSSAAGAATTSTSSKSTSTKKKKGARSAKKAKTYVVKRGDVLGSISEKTGVPVSDLLDYNDIDAQSLDVGQKLKLTP